MAFPLKETLQELCIPVDFIQGKCIVFPGGAEICMQFPRIPTDGGEAVRKLFEQINAALAPLTPMFNIIDAVLAVFQCVQAVPDAITNLDPTALIECVPDMVEKINRLLALIPQLTLPAMIVALIDLIIDALVALMAQLRHIAAEQARIIAAGIRAAEPGNVALRTILDCATGDLNVFLQYANEGMAPLNRLIGIIGAFCAIIGVDFGGAGLSEITDFAAIEASLAPIEQLVEVLQILRNSIPL